MAWCCTSHLAGCTGQVGTKSRVVFQAGQQQFEAIETITRREPLDLHSIPGDRRVHFEGEIVANGMLSATRDRFIETGRETTRREGESEYLFSGLMMRLVGLFMPSAVRKHSLQHMLDFKAFAEQRKDVREAKR